MKELFIKLSSIFGSSSEKRLTYQNATPEHSESADANKGKKPEAMAKSANEQERAAREEAAARAKKAADLPGLDAAIAKLTGQRGAHLNPEHFEQDAVEAAAEPGKNAKATDVGLAKTKGHDTTPVSFSDIAIEKKGKI